VDPETGYQLWLDELQADFEEIRGDLADGMLDFYWVESVESFSYDPAANEVVIEAISSSDKLWAEWCSRGTTPLTTPSCHGVMASGLPGSRASRLWREGLVLSINGDAYVVHCPGDVVFLATQVAMTRSDFQEQCTVSP
jgi:hypothetical protein